MVVLVLVLVLVLLLVVLWGLTVRMVHLARVSRAVALPCCYMQPALLG